MFNHPFVLRLFTTFQDSSRVYFLTEVLRGGELWSIIYESSSGFEAGTFTLSKVEPPPPFPLRIYYLARLRHAAPGNGDNNAHIKLWHDTPGRMTGTEGPNRVFYAITLKNQIGKANARSLELLIIRDNLVAPVLSRGTPWAYWRQRKKCRPSC